MPTSIGLAAHLAVAHLERRGIDPAPLLASVWPVAGCRSRSGNVSRSSAVIDFLERVSRAVEDDWLGLTLAADFDLREMGMLYYVAASSQRFGDALKRLDRYERVANEALDLRVVKGADWRIVLSDVGVPRHLDRHLMESFAVTLAAALPPACRPEARALLRASFVHHRADGRKMQQHPGLRRQLRRLCRRDYVSTRM